MQLSEEFHSLTGLRKVLKAGIVAFMATMTVLVPADVANSANSATQTSRVTQLVKTQGQLSALIRAGVLESSITSAQFTSAYSSMKEKGWGAGPPTGCSLQTSEPIADYRGLKVCGIYGDTKSKRLIVLVGDSHAGIFRWVFNAFGVLHHYRVQLLERDGCQMAEIPEYYPTCTSWGSNAAHIINLEKPRAVIISDSSLSTAYNNLSSSSYAAGQTAFYLDIKHSGRLVFQIGDTSAPSQNIPSIALESTCISQHLSNLQLCSLSAQAEAASFEQNQAGLAAAGGARFIPVNQLFCTALVCPPIIDGNLVYWDGEHVSPPFLELIAPVIDNLMVAHGLN